VGEVRGKHRGSAWEAPGKHVGSTWEAPGKHLGSHPARSLARFRGRSSVLEAITVVGAIVGLATGLFTVWDRWARGRPLAWATAEKFGANPLEYIRIKNPGHGDLFIRGVRAYPPTIYGV